MTDPNDERGTDRRGATGGYTVYEMDPDESASDAVVRAVAALNDRRPAEMEPLYGTTDPDALDAMFGLTPDGDVRTDGRLVLFFEGCEVVLEGTTIRVRRLPTGAE